MLVQMGRPSYICQGQGETNFEALAARFATDHDKELPYTVYKVYLSTELRLRWEARYRVDLGHVASVNTIQSLRACPGWDVRI